MLTWPDRAAVDRAVRQWAKQPAGERPEAIRIGYFGSYARGDWGVGSDVDVIIIVESAEEPFDRRPLPWDATGLPVPAEVFVYAGRESESIPGAGFAAAVRREAVWVWERGAA